MGGSAVRYYLRQVAADDLNPKDPVRRRTAWLDKAYEQMHGAMQSLLGSGLYPPTTTLAVRQKPGAATAYPAMPAKKAKPGTSSASDKLPPPHIRTIIQKIEASGFAHTNFNDKLSYRLEDFEPVAPVATVPFAFVVKKDFPAKTIKEYAAYAKANPGKINNATNGQASMVHLLGELIATGLDVKLTQVHYKGAAPATMDMIGGVIDSNVEALTSAVPNVNAGQYRALAVLSQERLPLMPEVPTFRELGYPSIVGETWYGVFVPAGTPKPVVDRLSAALRKITTSASFGENMRKIGNEAKSGSPAELLATTLEQRQLWGDLIKRLNIKAE